MYNSNDTMRQSTHEHHRLDELIRLRPLRGARRVEQRRTVIRAKIAVPIEFRIADDREPTVRFERLVCEWNVKQVVYLYGILIVTGAAASRMRRLNSSRACPSTMPIILN